MLTKLTVTVSASIASLKVKRTVEFVATPVAPVVGTHEIRVGCACTCQRPTSATAAARSGTDKLVCFVNWDVIVKLKHINLSLSRPKVLIPLNTTPLLLPNPIQVRIRPQENGAVEDGGSGRDLSFDLVFREFLELFAGFDHSRFTAVAGGG